MAESVRELVVTLSLDAGTFSKTCTDINKQIKNVQSEFNAITGGVDGWQSTIEGRKAKLDALTGTFDLQQQKISLIAAELDKANKALAADPTNLNKARKVSDLETQLNNAKAAATNTKLEIEKINQIKFDEFGKKMNTIGASLKTFGRKWSMYIGGPLAALGVKSYNAALDFETATVSMQKTIDETDTTKYEDISNAFLKMSESGPVPYTELMELAGAAGALGVVADDVVRFVESVSKLSVTADDLDANTGMTQLAKLMNITEQGDYTNVENVASALTDLGNRTNATEGEILAMAQRMASTGELAGMATTDILAMAAGFVSVGIEAEVGGSAAGKLMKQMQSAAELGSKSMVEFSTYSETAGQSARDLQLAADNSKWVANTAANLGKTKQEVKDMIDSMVMLEQFSGVMDVTPAQFIAGWDANAGQSIMDFFKGLNEIEAGQGEDSVLSKLNEMGLTEIRLSNLVASAATNPELFKNALAISDEAYKTNIALSAEAEKRYATAESRQQTQLNVMENAAADVGENVVDTVQPLIETVTRLVSEFGKLDEATQDNWVKVAGALIILGPAAAGVGSVASGIGTMVQWLAKLTPANASAATTVFGSMKSLLTTAAPIAATIWALVELAKSTSAIIENEYGMGDTLGKTGVSDAVTQLDQTTESGKKANEQLETYNKLVEAIKNPVNTTTDTQAKVELWTPFFTQEVRDDMFGGLSVEQLVGDNMLGSFIFQYKTKLEADIAAATSEASSAGVGAGATEGLAAATPTAETAASGLATAVDNAFTGELGIKSPSTVFIQHGLDTAMGMNIGLLQGLPVVVGAMTTLGAALTAIAAAQGTAAGSAYGSAFSSAASIQLNASMAKIKRELDNMNIRINRGYGV